MNKAQAIHNFWSSFDLLAIDEQSAYDERDIELPANYITYELQTANFGDPIQLSASLWYYSTSWEEITEKTNEIAVYIGYGGRMLEVDGGYIWVKLGSPFAQRMAVEQENYRRMILNITVDFLTAV